jgi:ketosteroid isomerase-like protein
MGAKQIALCVSVLLLTGCSKHQPTDDSGKARQDIQAQLDRWAKAFEAKDVNGVMAVYALGSALTAYDLVPPLEYKGADAYRKDYADFFAQMDGPLHVEIRDTHIETAGDLALAYGLERITGKLKSGQPLDIWVRYTSGFRRIGGEWRDIHDHVSVPADLDSGKAMLGLKPSA